MKSMGGCDRNYGDLRLFRVSPSKRSLLSLAVVFVILESSYLIIESYWNPLRTNLMYKLPTTSNLQQYSTSTNLKYIIKNTTDEHSSNYRCIHILIPNSGANRDVAIYQSLLHSRVINESPRKNKNLSLSRSDILFEDYAQKGINLDNSTRYIWIPSESWRPHVKVHENISLVLVRTRKSLELLQEYRRRRRLDFTLVYTKQSRADTYRRESDKAYDQFLYVGSTSDPHLHLILTAWSLHPSWPNITILLTSSHGFPISNSSKQLKNVKFIHKFNEKDVETYQSYISVHLLPPFTGNGSSYDINMARSTASLIVIGDNAPFNELINEESGVIIGKKLGSMRYINDDDGLQITVDALTKAVEKVLGMSIIQRKIKGENARQRYLADALHFQAVMEALNTTLCNGVNKSQSFSFDLLTSYVH